jgi:hypothetical protein
MKTLKDKKLHKLELKTVKKEDIPDVSNTIKPITIEEFMQWQRNVIRRANEQHKKLMESIGNNTTNINEDFK